MLYPLWANAGSLGVSPVRVDLASPDATAALDVTNQSETPVVIQIESMDWSMPDGQDHYMPSNTLLATPPIFSLGAGHTQVVRVGLKNRSSIDRQRELAYRLFLQEVPPPVAIDQTGLRVALRLGVPVFSKPNNPDQAPVQWQAKRTGNNSITVKLQNTRNQHIKILSIELYDSAEGRIVAYQKGVTYVLAGAFASWTLHSEKPLLTAPLSLNAMTDSGIIHAELSP